jgi:hypothetical protein
MFSSSCLAFHCLSAREREEARSTDILVRHDNAADNAAAAVDGQCFLLVLLATVVSRTKLIRISAADLINDFYAPPRPFACSFSPLAAAAAALAFAFAADASAKNLYRLMPPGSTVALDAHELAFSLSSSTLSNNISLHASHHTYFVTEPSAMLFIVLFSIIICLNDQFWVIINPHRAKDSCIEKIRVIESESVLDLPQKSTKKT